MKTRDMIIDAILTTLAIPALVALMLLAGAAMGA